MNHNENSSLLKKYLTKSIFDQLKSKRTESGFTLHHAIQSGIINQDSSIGIYAGDAEAYKVFAKIFNPVIADYHSLYPNNPTNIFHESDLSVIELKNPDPDHKYILSTRIRIAKNIAGFAFTPFITAKDRKKLESKVVNALELLDSDLKGRYIPIQKISEAEHISFKKNHIMFNKGDRFQEAAGINRDWPEARGIFISDDEKFIVWVNEEDHLRIISMEKGGQIAEAFNRIGVSLSALDKTLGKTLGKTLVFSFDRHLGYLTSCPSNLGTGMRAGVHIRLPELHKKKELLFKIADSFNLQIRGTRGEKTGIEKAIFDISNRQRLGITEKKCIQTLYAGLVSIIEMEKKLTRGKLNLNYS